MKHIPKIRNAVIILICAVAVASVLSMFKIQDKDAFQAWDSFYSEKKDSIDIIYIGASNVYPFWSAPLYWKESGHTVFPLSISSMPSRAIKYMIEEARKTQPSASFVVCLNTFKTGSRHEPASIHYVCDYMKLSKTKIDLIDALAEDAGFSGTEKIEFYLPFVRFHSRWKDFSKKDYILRNYGIKNAISTSNSMNEIQDVSSTYRITSSRIGCTDEQLEIMNELLDYCDDNGIRLLFTIVPQAINDESIIGQLNMLGDLATERGHQVVDLLSSYQDYDLQLNQDFYNSNHINVHGALKFTRHLGELFDSYYDLSDKRGNDLFESWDKSYDNYIDLIDEHVLDFEIDGSERDPSLGIPVIASCAPDTEGILIKWEAVNGASGYYVYRKTRDVDSGKVSAWERIGGTDETSYQDIDAVGLASAWYTVVPYRIDNDEILYGNYDYSGKSTSFNIKAPVLDSLTCETDGNTIRWKPVKGASGYKVYRQINGQRWIQLADIDAASETLAYTDTYFQKDLPYLYSVSAYRYDNQKNIRESNIDRKGLLYNENGLEAPVLSVSLAEDGSRILQWQEIKGANYYALFGRTEGDWKLIKDGIPQSTTRYADSSFSAGRIEYKLCAVIKYGDSRFVYESDIVTSDSQED